MHCTKLLSKVCVEQHLETLVYVCDKAYYNTHSPLIVSASTGTQYFAAVTVLNTYNVHDLNNSLDTYSSFTVHEQDSVVARHERTNYTHAIACMQYST